MYGRLHLPARLVPRHRDVASASELPAAGRVAAQERDDVHFEIGALLFHSSDDVFCWRRVPSAVHLVNPSHLSFGVGVITPRWLFVLGAATPAAYGRP